MLAVQVSLNNVKELSRHNQVAEAQNEIALDIQQQQVTETMRSNRANEAIKWAQTAETARSNRVNESIARESNQIAWKNAYTQAFNAETNRKNYLVNLMNARTNRIKVNYDYEIGMRNVAVNEANANTNRLKAMTAVEGLKIDQQNANTNRMNAGTNRINALTNKAKYELDVSKFKWQMLNDVIDNAWRGIENIGNVVNKPQKTTIYRILE